MKFARQSRRAFTLVEIMVAIAIFMLVIAAIYSVWAAIMRSTQVAQDVAAQAQRERITLRTIEDAIEGVQSYQASPQYYSFILENGSSPELSFTALVPEMFPRNGKFINPNTGRSFDLRRLTFSLEQEQNGDKNLVLRQNPVLMDMDEDEQKYPLVLAKHISEFTVEGWGTNAATGRVGWMDEWLDTNSIPQMLRVKMVMNRNLKGGNAPSEVSIARVYSIPSQTMPAFVQRGGAAGAPNPGNPGGPSIKLPTPTR